MFFNVYQHVQQYDMARCNVITCDIKQVMSNTCASQVLDLNLSPAVCRTYGWVQLLAIAGERAQSTETQPVVCAVNTALKPQRSFIHVEDNTDDVWRLEARLHVIRVLVDDTVVEQADVGDNVPTQRFIVGTQQRRVTW